MNQATIVRTSNLVKSYKEHKAVDSVSMTINKGDIYGFIGKNGAGKTTFIRLLTGLINQSAGELTFNATGKMTIGAVIEGPACYPYLTASDNLMYYAVQQRIPDKKARVKEVLAFVGLAKTGKKLFKDFSLGMKQRLGIGLAILNKPDFLILDEPVNGLDPQGIVEIREIIQTLNQEHGTTILISSHILSELSMIATRYGIINEGKLIKELSKEQLEDECQKSLLLNSSDNQKAMSILEESGYSCELSDQGIQLLDIEKTQMATIAEILYQQTVYLVEAAHREENLEDYYLNLINGGVKHV